MRGYRPHFVADFDFLLTIRRCLRKYDPIHHLSADLTIIPSIFDAQDMLLEEFTAPETD